MSEFNPADYLIKLQGKDYLEVKWRLVWLNHACQHFTIDTEVVELNERRCVCKARVGIWGNLEDAALDGMDDPGWGRSAVGIGSETPDDFRDYVEKAQTKAIGRALAMLGFGTQFADADGFDSEAARDRPVDAPVARPSASAASSYTPTANGDDKPKAIKPGNEDKPASEAQINFLNSLAEERGINLQEWCPDKGLGAYSNLNRENASWAIENIKAEPRKK